MCAFVSLSVLCHLNTVLLTAPLHAPKTQHWATARNTTNVVSVIYGSAVAMTYCGQAKAKRAQRNIDNQHVFQVTGSCEGASLWWRVGGGWTRWSRAQPHPFIPTLTQQFKSDHRSEPERTERREPRLHFTAKQISKAQSAGLG